MVLSNAIDASRWCYLGDGVPPTSLPQANALRRIATSQQTATQSLTTMATNNQPLAHFRLLALPVELRTMIYH